MQCGCFFANAYSSAHRRSCYLVLALFKLSSDAHSKKDRGWKLLLAITEQLRGGCALIPPASSKRSAEPSSQILCIPWPGLDTGKTRAEPIESALGRSALLELAEMGPQVVYITIIALRLGPLSQQVWLVPASPDIIIVYSVIPEWASAQCSQDATPHISLCCSTLGIACAAHSRSIGSSKAQIFQQSRLLHVLRNLGIRAM